MEDSVLRKGKEITASPFYCKRQLHHAGQYVQSFEPTIAHAFISLDTAKKKYRTADRLAHGLTI